MTLYRQGKLIGVLLTLAACNMAQPPAEPHWQGPNLLRNPSFETLGSDGYPAEWQWREGSGADRGTAHAGEVALKLTGPSAEVYTSQNLELMPHTPYLLHGWVRARNLSTGEVRLRWAPASGGSSDTQSVHSSTDWRELWSVFTTEADGRGRVDLVWEGLNTGAEIWIDDLYLGVAPSASLEVYPQARSVRQQGGQAEIAVRLLDASGQTATKAQDTVRFSLEGSGRLVGPNPAPAQDGWAYITYQSDGGSGPVTIRAEVGGLPPVTTTLQRSTQGMELSFPLGLFEDANMTHGYDEMKRWAAELKARGFDAVMLINANVANRGDDDGLRATDEAGLEVYFNPGDDFNREWWPEEIPPDPARARSIAQELLKRLSPHPSLGGYYVADEPFLKDVPKVAPLQKAFQEADFDRPSMSVLIGRGRGELIYQQTRPDVMLLDVYPVGYSNAVGDFTLRGFGYSDLDFVSYLRLLTRDKPRSVPLWLILQTHSFEDQLREPTPSEVRAQNWLAVGEGAKGIFWFIYSSQQGWRGLKDNPALYDEVSHQTRRVAALRGVLKELFKVPDRFEVSGADVPYASSLQHRDGRHFVVVVNRDCQNPRRLSVRSDELKGRLKDLESGQIYAQGAELEYAPGDGRVFEVVP